LIVLSTFTLVDSGLNDEYYLRKAVDDIQIILPIYEREYEKISKLGGALMKEKSSNFDEDKAFVYALLIIKYSKLYKVDPHLIAAIMAKESEFNPNAVSKAKAKGLMQIHQPAYKLPDKVLFDPEQNIKIGIRILLMHKNINPKGFLKDYGGFESQEKRLTEGVKYEKDVRNKRERIRRITSRGGV
jgi:soluble lytic murein transglycosylase-like protein